MTSPRWARALLRFVAPPSEADDVVGDYEEAHVQRRARRGPLIAWVLSSAEALDLAASIAWARFRHLGPGPRSPSEAAKTDALSGLGVSWLDFRLGFRMLVRFPGLTIVAGLAIAFAIAVGAGTFEFARDLVYPRMPFEGGDRVVEIWHRNVETTSDDRRTLHDFEVWREEVETVQELGAYRAFRRNLRTERGAAEAVLGAEIGVMPEGFGWPVAFRLWTPLRLRASDYERGQSPSMVVVGKLAGGVSLREARAELSALGARAAADHPETHASLRPTVQPYGSLADEATDLVRGLIFSVNIITFVALTLLVCGNVALLLFARTAARQSEIVVRGALGASRGRIVLQLVAEALVLTCAASAFGLIAADIGLGWVVGAATDMTSGTLGYWFHRELTAGTIVYATSFTLFAAVVAGALPALKLTGAGVQGRLQRLSTSGSGVEFGRLWSTVIVSQIAATVAFVPIIAWTGLAALEVRNAPFGFPADEYLMAELRSSADAGGVEELARGLKGGGYTAAYRQAYEEVKRRLSAEPGVAAVTVAEQVPGGAHWGAVISLEGPTAPREEQGYGHGVYISAVDLDFFRAVDASILDGRAFTTIDEQPGQHPAIVNEDFVRVVLEDRNAVGRRFQFADRRLGPDEPNPGPWYEIVGVVEQRPTYIDGEGDDHVAVYLPLGSNETYPVRLAVRVGADPNGFAPRLGEIVAAVDPTSSCRTCAP